MASKCELTGHFYYRMVEINKGCGLYFMHDKFYLCFYSKRLSFIYRVDHLHLKYQSIHSERFISKDQTLLACWPKLNII